MWKRRVHFTTVNTPEDATCTGTEMLRPSLFETRLSPEDLVMKRLRPRKSHAWVIRPFLLSSNNLLCFFNDSFYTSIMDFNIGKIHVSGKNVFLLSGSIIS